MLRFAPTFAIAILCLPLLAGTAGTLLPAFGYLPAIGGDRLTLAPFAALLAEPGLFRSALTALATGLVSTFLSVAIVALFVCGWYGTRTFATLQHLVAPLLAVPHAAAAFALAFMIAPSGFVARLLSPWATGWDRPPDLLIVNDAMGLALVAGLVVKEVPFLLLVTLAAIPQSPVMAALPLVRSLGHGRTLGLLLAVWPGLYRQIRLAVFAVIAYATSNVDMAVILGPTLPPTLPVRLVGWMNDADLSRRFVACAGALVQIGVTAVALLLWIILERLTAAIGSAIADRGLRGQRERAVRFASGVAMALAATVVFGGLALLALWSVAGLWSFPDAWPQSLTIRTWEKSLPSVAAPLANTLSIAGLSTVLSVIIVLACLQRENETGRTGGNRALLLVYLPLLVPQIGFLFGLQLLLVSGGWDASLGALVLVHMVFVLPYVFLSLTAPWRAFDRRYEAIAIGLGASPSRVFWAIRLPMMLRAVLVATAVGFAVSVGQYLPTLLVGAGRFPTITTEAVALGAGGNRRVIGVYAFLQLALPFLAFAVASAVPALLFRNRRAIQAA